MTDYKIRKIARALAQPATYMGLAMLAFIYCVVAYLIISGRQGDYAAALSRGENLVRITSQSYSHMFKSVDATLLFLRKSYQLNPSAFRLADWVSDSSIRNELVFNFAILDASGRVVDTTFSKAVIGSDRSDLQGFQPHLNSNADNLFIGNPCLLRISQRWAIPLSRRITAPDGTFAGVIFAFLNPLELGRHVAHVDLGKDGAFALVGFDGFMYTRVVEGKVEAATIGEKLAPQTAVMSHLGPEKSGHYWNKPQYIDGISRFISYRTIDSFPLTAVVGVSEAEVYRHSTEDARIYLGIVVLLTLAIIAAIYFGAVRERRLIDTTSEMRQAKTALAQSNQELERRVEERTADLAQEMRRREEVQMALARSQERYELVENAANDGIFDRNLLTGEAYFSPRWKNILGYADDELPNVASSFFDLIHPDDESSISEALRVHLGESKPYALEFRLRCKNGDYKWVHSRGKIFCDATNRPVRILGSTTDITERKQAEALIEQSRDSLARAEKIALLGHTRFEQASGKYTWSEGLYRIMGKSPASFTPTPDNALELIHPEDRPTLAQYRRDVMAGIEVPRKTLRAIREDGQIIYVEYWSVPIRASDGTVTARFSTVQDITERKQAEALIEESRNNLERAERQALLGHHKIEKASGQLTWSEGVYRIFGKSPASFTPTLNGTLELIHPDDRLVLKHYRRDTMAGLECPPITLRAVRDDGRIIYVENWLVPIRESDGTVSGVFGTIQDVTARKQAEAALAQTNQELETRVAERTAELSQEMHRREQAQMTLAQMQKMEAVGQLTAGIAHDFNNLLAVIKGCLQFVEEAAMRGLPTKPELIDAGLRATQRGAELVRRLIAFSRQSPLKAESTMVDQLVLDTLRLLQRTLGEKVEIVTELNATGAAVSVDRSQLANALVNLAVNARDAMPDGGRLTISTLCRRSESGGAHSPPKEEVCIVISDTGAGMTDEVRKRVFEPFFTTKPDGLGSGLGLSMVHGFVEQSAGHIEIDSAVGRGTTITIKLPRITAVTQSDDRTEIGDSSATEKEKTVLLVEDDPDVRIVTAAQLKRLGYNVHAVANGIEAIDLIASPANIDITLTDIVLPGGMDGFALVKEVMRVRPRMGVLCMSGYDPTQKHRKWLAIQNIEFLEKPFSVSRLAQALDAVLPQ